MRKLARVITHLYKKTRMDYVIKLQFAFGELKVISVVVGAMQHIKHVHRHSVGAKLKWWDVTTIFTLYSLTSYFNKHWFYDTSPNTNTPSNYLTSVTDHLFYTNITFSRYPPCFSDKFISKLYSPTIFLFCSCSTLCNFFHPFSAYVLCAGGACIGWLEEEVMGDKKKTWSEKWISIGRFSNVACLGKYWQFRVKGAVMISSQVIICRYRLLENQGVVR